MSCGCVACCTVNSSQFVSFVVTASTGEGAVAVRTGTAATVPV
jgi:hypothetical protein